MKKSVVSTSAGPKKPPTASNKAKTPWQMVVHSLFVDLHVILIEIAMTWALIHEIVKLFHPPFGQL